ncbi:hypothetical protein PAXRUDRAFT_17551 [Paxillus rubicundulus Ve08.2h10]|uniref:Uncharacterized protein n=1 Tax=Paxillus rubicundulus Ve08.2h10 TaxID=930991 RepID=A0A0D0DH87_9AGAM|nr:hypothetical protein PAXRUDRAFT_17551 [Paxillus rubicundulus Ve08.2h10]
MNIETVPNTLNKWIAKAEHFHVQNQQIQALKSRTTFIPRSSNPTHDPNTMDVDAVKLTPLQQAEYMKKGLCFICGKQVELPLRGPPLLQNQLLYEQSPTPTQSAADVYFSELHN